MLQLAVIGQSPWVLKKSNNGIKVFSRKSPVYKFDELKVECQFDGRISQLVAVLLDIPGQSKWVYKTSKSEIIEKTGATDLVYYTEIDSPWPFDNRDLVVRMTMNQNIHNKQLTIVAKNIDGYIPVKKNIVRINYSNATWQVIPLNNNQFKIEYILQLDPGAGLPIWLLNLFSTEGPYETFLNLKAKIKLPQYAAATFPFIKD